MLPTQPGQGPGNIFRVQGHLRHSETDLPRVSPGVRGPSCTWADLPRGRGDARGDRRLPGPRSDRCPRLCCLTRAQAQGEE